jgi:hypothetical protein
MMINRVTVIRALLPMRLAGFHEAFSLVGRQRTGFWKKFAVRYSSGKANGRLFGWQPQTHRPELPLLLLDVDGVINHWSYAPYRKLLKATEWSDSRSMNVAGYTINYSPTVVNTINRFHREALAEVRWLTAWDDRAQTSLAPSLGFEHFELARGPRVSKGDAAKAWHDLHPTRSIVWIDDELEDYSREHADLWRNRPSTLFISPPCELIPKQLETVEEFLVQFKLVREAATGINPPALQRLQEVAQQSVNSVLGLTKERTYL